MAGSALSSCTNPLTSLSESSSLKVFCSFSLRIPDILQEQHLLFSIYAFSLWNESLSSSERALPLAYTYHLSYLLLILIALFLCHYLCWFKLTTWWIIHTLIPKGSEPIIMHFWGCDCCTGLLLSKLLRTIPSDAPVACLHPTNISSWSYSNLTFWQDNDSIPCLLISWWLGGNCSFKFEILSVSPGGKNINRAQN